MNTVDCSECKYSSEQRICPGDTIVASDEEAGRALEFNPFNNNNMISYSNSFAAVYTVYKASVAIGVGCLDLYCVGDDVVTNLYSIAKVFAVNSDNSIVGVRIRTVAEYTVRVETLALGCGVFEAFVLQI